MRVFFTFGRTTSLCRGAWTCDERRFEATPQGSKGKLDENRLCALAGFKLGRPARAGEEGYVPQQERGDKSGRKGLAQARALEPSRYGRKCAKGILLKRYWIFILKEASGRSLEEFRTRIGQRHWGLYKSTKNRKIIQDGDAVVFYLAGEGGQKFLGTAAVEREPFIITPRLKAKSPSLSGFDYAIRLSNIELYKTPVRIREVLPRLEFIRNKQYYGVYLQGGVKQIGESDFAVLEEYGGRRTPA